ncbi:DUF3168 domain-containing protein [Mechercharimyces sp. CAU 1602]|uniref:DUF3168 domain-containing protein n=1 Tax=Mechercharimyces sp. CAU 1602 TaxID=2973933 RepID=UPI002161F73A|nr:DUF3168 domain-containing protein [Mechercharimyces sp. CAU 1602]MCS1351148.1 DUF3168 domain-containing protein [Mechercharimyces sp. CAU 1602]
MMDVQAIVYGALRNNDALLTLLGGDRIEYLKSEQNDFPYITYFFMNQTEGDYLDDEAVSEEVSMQVSIWVKNKGDEQPIAVEVDRTMKVLGLKRTLAMDLFEDDTQVIHKLLRYKGIFLKGE